MTALSGPGRRSRDHVGHAPFNKQDVIWMVQAFSLTTHDIDLFAI
jgi:hypothetical protein